jgi:DNA repair protein RadC/GNAT superfamily N-acetyltransferase
MAGLAEFRKQYPQYDDLSDQQLADALHQKHYSDIPKADYYRRLGFNPGEAPRNDVTAAELADAERPAQAIRLKGGRQVAIVRPDAYRDNWDKETQGEPVAPWTGEGGVLEALPGMMVAGTRSAVAGVRRMAAEESAQQRREALGTEQLDSMTAGETPGGAVTGMVRRSAVDRQRAALKRDEAAAAAATVDVNVAQTDLLNITPRDMNTAQQAVSSLAQSAPPTLLGVAAGILTRNPGLAMSIAGGGGSAIQAGSTYNEARKEGASHRLSAMAATIDGILEGVGEALPLGIALKQGSPIANRIFGTIVAEAGQEAATQAMQDFNAFLTYNPKITLQEAWQNLKVAALTGAMGGAVYGTAGAVADAGRQRAAVQRDAADVDPNAATDMTTGQPVATATPPQDREPEEPKPGAGVDAINAELNEIADLEDGELNAMQLAMRRAQQRAAANGDGTRANPVDVSSEEDIEAVGAQVETAPTDAQKEAGNYAKGHVKLQGLDITIENPKGSERSGGEVDPAEIGTRLGGDGDVAAVIERAARAYLEQGAAAGRAVLDGMAASAPASSEFAQRAAAPGFIDELDMAIREETEGKTPRWSVTMPAAYGYVKRTTGKDGDQVDVYIGPNPKSRQVYIIDQIDPKSREFDEHKVMLGFDDQSEAMAAYDQAFSDGTGESRRGAVTPMSMDAFRKWLRSGDTTEPFAYTFRSPVYDALQDENLRASIVGMRAGIGAEERGGRLIIDEANRDRAPGFGDVLGKTQWIGNDWWFDRPDQGLLAPQARRAIDKALAGERLGSRELRFIEYLVERAREFDAQFDADFIEASGYNDLTPEEKATLDDVLADAIAVLGESTVEDIKERLAIQTESEAEYESRLREELGAAVAAAGNREAVAETAEGETGESAGRGEQDSRAPPESPQPVVDETDEQTPSQEGVSVSAVERGTAPEHTPTAGSESGPSIAGKPVADMASSSLALAVRIGGDEVRAIAQAELKRRGHEDLGASDAEVEAVGKEMAKQQENQDDGDGYQVTHVFDPPAKDEIVRAEKKARVYHDKHGWMTVEEAKAKIDEWKAHAAAQGKTGANSEKVVLSLFDLTGAWSQPWADAGYQVFRFDIQNDPEVGDVEKFSAEFFNDIFASFEGRDIFAILAACPCTDFAVSGARHFAAKDADGRTIRSVELVRQTMATIEYFKPAVWALENPVGRIEKLTGLPPWRLSFDPNHFGDPYTKKTLLWGRFNADLPVVPVEPSEGSKMWAKYGGKSMATKNARSATPEGFAYAFFMANNAIDNPVMAIANQWDRLDRKLIEQAVEAGVTAEQIQEAVEDFYYQDLDDAAANNAIRDLITAAKGGGTDAAPAAEAESPAGDAQPLELTGETPAELAAKAQAEAARKMAEAAEALKATADAMRDTFTLTGSNRPADEAAARGQGDLLAPPAESQEPRPKKAFTFAIKPVEGGFVIESDDGGGMVMAGRPGPGVLNNTPPRVFGTRDEALAYMRDKGMQLAETGGEKIEDFGEKIGGARKDTARPVGGRGATDAEESAEPGWRKRFSVSEIVAGDDKGKWALRDTKKTDWAGRPRQIGELFSSKEDAEQAIPLAAVSQKHRPVPVPIENPVEGGPTQAYEIWRDVTDKKRIKVVDQQFPTREDALRYMAENAVKIIETKTNFGEEILAKPERVMRSGAERRTVPATPAMFMEAFGFRGVEFGNWNNQSERQEVMNHAYDGLMDLAEVLGVPPKALSLNGDLGLAFGARGQGLSGAKAHYEPDYGVINLTKMTGAGSLAHEWFHAADHYFARQDGKAKSERVKNKAGDLVYDAVSPRADMATYGFRATNSGVREEVRAAYKDLVNTMFTKAVQYVEDTKKAEKFVGGSRDALARELEKIRADLMRGPKELTYMKRNNKPASAEQLAQFDQLSEKLLSGEALEVGYRPNPASEGIPMSSRKFRMGRHTNDTLEAISAILKAVRGRSGFTSDNSGVLDGIRYLMKNYLERINMLKSAESKETKTRQVPTSFAMDAKRIDQGRATNYWTTEHEMAARAFSAYVEDKVAEKGNRSDFLAYGSDNKFYALLNLRPFPEGAEREAINAAFDRLFGTLQTRETDRGTALFQNDAAYLARTQNRVENKRREKDEYTADLFGAALPEAGGARRDAGQAQEERDLDAFGALPGQAQPAIIVEPAQRGVLRMGFDRIDTPQKAAHAFAALRKYPREYFQILLTDDNDKPVAAWTLFSGTLTQTSVYPREVITAAYMTPGAKKVWFAHNHPSGVPSPSRADEVLTAALGKGFGKGLGVQFAGHVIIAGDQAAAFDNVNFDMQSLTSFKIPPKSRKFAVPLMERMVRRQSNAPRTELTSPGMVRDYIERLPQGNSGLLLLDAQHRALAWLPMTRDEMSALREQGRGDRLFQAIGRLNPAAAIAYFPEQLSRAHENAVANLGTALQLIDVRMLDAFVQDGTVMASFAERGYTMSRPDGVFFSRSKGWSGFPEALIGSTLGSSTRHPDYRAAKAGDTDAAWRVVRDIMPDETIERVRSMLGGRKPVVVPVHAQEAAGRNKLPVALARLLADRLGLEVATDIVQASAVHRGGKDGFYRLANQPQFDGPVAAGDYLLVDDTLTQGGTIAQLAEHIEQGGGRVAGVVALTGKQYSARIGLTDGTLAEIRQKHADLEPWWREQFGYGFDGLTESEARYILVSGQSSDAIRNRVTAARLEGGGRPAADAGANEPRFSRSIPPLDIGQLNAELALKHTAVQIVLAEQADAIGLEGIRVPDTSKRGTGRAAAAMRDLTAAADRHRKGVILMAYPDPEDLDSMSLEDLVEWYRKFGFEALPEQEFRDAVVMYREPRGQDNAIPDSAYQAGGTQESEGPDGRRIPRAGETPEESAGQDPGEISAFRSTTSPATAGLSVSAIENALRPILDRWQATPDVVIMPSIAQAPEAIRVHDEAQRSQGASGGVEGVIWGGRVYLFADQINSVSRAQTVLFHEVLGHYGLRGAFGEALDPILDQLANVRSGQVTRKAREYGLDPSNPEHRRHAAEEVLAELAQTQPQITWVQRAVAAIKRFLRSLGLNIPASDADIIADYILPARGFVERGGRGRGLHDLAPAAASRASTGSPTAVDGDAAQVTQDDLEELSNQIVSKHGLDDLTLWLHKNGDVEISTIINFPENRGRGAGTRAMNDIIQFADAHGLRLILSPAQRGDPGGTTSRARLVRFYKRFGFVENKGRNRDFKIMQSMIRAPQTSAFSRADQTNTPEFRRWFGDSKVVDAQGRPLVVYHGSQADFSVFQNAVERGGDPMYGQTGLYFAEDSGLAGIYGEGGSIYPVYLNIRNPLDLTDTKTVSGWKGLLARVIVPNMAKRVMRAENMRAGTSQSLIPQADRDKLIAAGYDGIKGAGGVWIAFRPEQIKSAVGNRGTFDAGNPDIRFSRKKVDEAIDDANADLKQPHIEFIGDYVGDLGAFKKFAVYPRTIAALEPDFTPVYRTAESQFETRDRNAAELARMAEKYFDLTAEQRAKVDAVLELGRLKEEVLAGPQMSMKNTGQAARLSEPGDTITLTDAEKSAYWGVRKMFNKALTMFRDQALRDFGIPVDKLATNLRDDLVYRASKAEPRQKAYLMAALEIYDQIERARKGGYVPFTRWGDVVVVVRDRTGATLWVEKVETGAVERNIPGRRNLENIPSVRRALDAVRQKFRAEQVEIKVFNTPERTPLEGDIRMADLDMLAELARVDNQQWESVRDQLAKGLQSRGFRKHFLGSANVPGYSTDFERAISDYIIGISGYLSRRQHADQWETSIAAIDKRKPRLIEYAKQYQQYVNDPQEEWYRLRQAGFLFYIAGVPASAFVNLTQVQLLSAPYLTQFAGAERVQLELARAYRDVSMMGSVSRGFDLFDPDKAPADVRDDLRAAWDEGFFVPLETYELMGKAYNRTPTQRRVQQAVDDSISAISIAFQGAERINRLVTYIAAHRIGRIRGVEGKVEKVLRNNPLAREELGVFTPRTFAEWVIDETHFRMGKINRPGLMRGAGAAVLQFRGFTLQTLELWTRMMLQNGPEGRAMAAYSLALMFAVAGIWGMPGADDLRNLLERFYKAIFGEDLDLKTKFRELVYRLSGSPMLAQIASKGVTYPAGLDLSGRIGMGNIAPDSPLQVFGIPADLLIGREMRALEMASRGHWQLAMAELLPNFIKNPMQAADWAESGIRSQATGKVAIPAEDITAGDVAQKAVGFTPARVSNIREAQFAKRRADMAVDELRRDYYAKLGTSIAAKVRAERAGDVDKVRRIEADIKATFAEIAERNRGKAPHEMVVIRAQTLRERVRDELEGTTGKPSRRRQARTRGQEIDEAYGLAK